LTIESTDLIHHLRDRVMFTSRERVFAVAPNTPHWTAGKANECARTTRMSRLALNGTEHFSDTKHLSPIKRYSRNLAQHTGGVKNPLLSPGNAIVSKTSNKRT